MTPFETFERIKELSKKHGLSLIEVNDKAGLGTRSIYHWNKTNPSTNNLKAVADVLHTTTDYLTGKTDDPSMPAKKEHKINQDPTFADLGMPYGGKIPEDLKDTYVDLAKSYFKRHPEMLNKE